MNYTTEDVARVAKNLAEAQDLEKFVLERAEIHARMTGNRRFPRTEGWGYKNSIQTSDLYSPDGEVIRVIETDNGPGAGGWSYVYEVPRDFVFGKPTEQEQKWEQYLALKAELEPDTEPAPRKKATGLVRNRADVTGCHWENYGIYCDKDVEADEEFCTKHKNMKCVLCGKPANHGCPVELQFVCGEPLCANHQIGRH